MMISDKRFTIFYCVLVISILSPVLGITDGAFLGKSYKTPLYLHSLAKVTKHLNKYHSKLFRYCYEHTSSFVIYKLNKR